MKKTAWYLVFTIVVLFMTVAVFIYLAPHLGWREACLGPDRAANGGSDAPGCNLVV